MKIDRETAELLSSKDNLRRFVRLDEIPGLIERTTPPPSVPVTSDSFHRDRGVLSELGYRVGAHAAMPAINRQIALRRVFNRPSEKLPVGIDEAYRAEWGDAGTVERFAKMARCLESFVQLHARHPDKYRRSIAEWKADLKWLETEIGDPYGFSLPPHHVV